MTDRLIPGQPKAHDGVGKVILGSVLIDQPFLQQGLSGCYGGSGGSEFIPTDDDG